MAFRDAHKICSRLRCNPSRAEFRAKILQLSVLLHRDQELRVPAGSTAGAISSSLSPSAQSHTSDHPSRSAEIVFPLLHTRTSAAWPRLAQPASAPPLSTKMESGQCRPALQSIPRGDGLPHPQQPISTRSLKTPAGTRKFSWDSPREVYSRHRPPSKFALSPR